MDPRARLLVAALAAAVLSPSLASAQFRYLAVGDARQSFNSHVYDLDIQGVDPGTNRGLVTEVEPGIRFYLGQRRSLLSMRYSFLGQMILIMRSPIEEVTGYGNRMQLNYTYRASPRTDFGVLNRFNQGTENVTMPPAVNAAGLPTTAQLVTAGSVMNESLRVGVEHLLAPRWAIRPQLTGEIYYPYGDPPSEDIPERTPVYTTELAVRLAWGWFQGSALVLQVGGSVLYQDTDPVQLLPDRVEGGQVVSYQNERSALPRYWRTLIGGATLAWRWQFTEFLDAEIAGGAQYYTEQYFCDVQLNLACPPTLIDDEGGAAPLVEGFIRYRRGDRLTATVGYGHGWTRQNELATSATTETDRAGLNIQYTFKDWVFEGMAAFLYMRTVLRGIQDDGGFPDGSKALTGELMASYRLRPGLSIGVSYHVDGLMDRSPVLVPISEEQVLGIEPTPANCPLNGNRLNCILTPNDIVRHIFTVGISVAWPPPPPQDVRLTRRESEYEPVFFIGESVVGDTGGGGATRRSTAAVPGTGRRRRTRPTWMGGVETPAPVGPASILPERPEQEEQPPLPDQAEEQQEDESYYSWPR
jgi:hypothetical protein